MNNISGIVLTTACLAILATFVPVWAEEESHWAEPRRLLESGREQDALVLLLKEEEQYIGLPEYDFLLARAYQGNGQWQNALFALERVLIIEPTHIPARLIAAGIHAARGKTVWARRELAYLSSETLSSDMQKEEARIRTLIVKEEARPGPLRVKGSLRTSIGFDSNVTYGPDYDSLLIPAWSGYTALGSAANDGDKFLRNGGEASFQYPLNRKFELSGYGDLSYKAHQKRNDVNEAYGNMHLGLSYRSGNDLFGITGMLQSYWVDNNPYSSYWGGESYWGHIFDAGSSVIGYLRYMDYTYSEYDTYDGGQTVAGLNHLVRFSCAGNAATLRYGLYGGFMQAKKADSEDVSHNLWGGLADVSYLVTPKIKVLANLKFEQRRHEAKDPLYTDIRRDQWWVVGISATYKLGDAWSLIPALSHTWNDSNMALYEYKRTLFTITLKWSFSYEGQ